MSSESLGEAQSLSISKSVSSNPRKSNRKFLFFSAFFLSLLLASSLLLESCEIPPFDPQVYRNAFTGRKYLIERVQLLQTRADDVDDVLHAEAKSRDTALQCDRSHYRTDVCVAHGDVKVLGGGGGAKGRHRYQVLVFADAGRERVEVVKPYTRKWESSVMSTIEEVKIIRKVVKNPIRPISGDVQHQEGAPRSGHGANGVERVHLQDKGSAASNESLISQHRQFSSAETKQRIKRQRRPPSSKRRLKRHELDDQRREECEVHHEVPAIVFSTGGYTGNVYHEFNDGLIPLYITAQQYGRPAGQVALVILEYHSWWMSKYSEVIAQLTNYTIVDFARDTRIHCFPEVTVGLHIHGELSIDSQVVQDGASMAGFQQMLHAAYRHSAAEIAIPGQMKQQGGDAAILTISQSRPKFVIISRTGPRALLNERKVVTVAREIGFSVRVLSPKPTTRMSELYGALNGCDVMMGVHGAAMTHLLFMRPGTTFIQVVPLGTDWAAETYYGEPARKLGLHYVGYKVSPRESSLWDHYASNDPVLVDPDSVNRRGWWETKRIYLERQNVTISIANITVILRAAYARAVNASMLRHPSFLRENRKGKHSPLQFAAAPALLLRAPNVALSSLAFLADRGFIHSSQQKQTISF